MPCTDNSAAAEGGSDLERVVLDGIGRLVGLEKVRFHALADSDIPRARRRAETAEFRLALRLNLPLRGDLAGAANVIRLEDWEGNLPPETLRWRALDERTVEVRTAFIPSDRDLDLILRLVLRGMYQFFGEAIQTNRSEPALRLDLEGGLVAFRDGSEVTLRSFALSDIPVRYALEVPVLEPCWAGGEESPRQQLWHLINAGLSRLKRRPLHAYVLRRDAEEGWTAAVDARWGGLHRPGVSRRPAGADFDPA